MSTLWVGLAAFQRDFIANELRHRIYRLMKICNAVYNKQPMGSDA